MTRSHDRHPDDDTILALAHGLLLEAERDEVLAHVRDCPQCEAELQACARTRETATSDGPPSSLLEMHPPDPALRTGAGRRWLATALVAVAASLVVWFGFDMVSTPDADTKAYWLATDLEPTRTRSDDPALPTGLDTALDAYDRRDLDASLEAFEALDTAGPWASLRDVYVFSILVNTGRFTEAGDILERIPVDSLPHEYRTATRWYRSLLHLETGRTDEAREELTALGREAGPIGDLAREKLQQLDPDPEGE